jgi:hypothetical protein
LPAKQSQEWHNNLVIGGMRTVAQKMGIKQNCMGIFIHAPAEAIVDIHLPEISVKRKLTGNFDYIHLFVKTQSEQKEIFPKLKEHLEIDGMLWVSWPKNNQLETDLSLPQVIKIGYSFGLVESTCLSVNKVWSAIKFTHPKKNKIYNNSHAKLTSRTTSR